MNKHLHFRHRLLLTALLTLIAALLAGCGGGRTAPVPPAQPAVPDFDIRRQTPVVNAGPTDPLPVLNDSNFHPFPPGHRVKTNTSGEALVQGDLDGKTCKIFVFKNTSLVKKACSKSSFQGSNTVCNEEGSALFIDCSSQLILTNSGAFQVKGSWVWVTYLPDTQLSLVAVLEGEANVRPVLNIDTGEMGEGMSLGPGQFYYTVPDERMMEVGGLQPRQVYPFERLPAAIYDLGLQDWSERVQVHADEGDVPYLNAAPILPTSGGGTVFVRGGGGPLEEQPVQEAIAQAIDWAAIYDSVFDDGTNIAIEMPQLQIGDAREIPYDPAFSKAMLAEMGYPYITLRLLATSADDQLWQAAEWMIGFLGDAGIQVELIDAGPGEAAAIFKEVISAGEPVIWLSR